jgi:hypothetical protein
MSKRLLSFTQFLYYQKLLNQNQPLPESNLLSQEEKVIDENNSKHIRRLSLSEHIKRKT